MKLSKMRWKLKIAGIFLLILTLLPQVCLAASYKASPNSSPANYSSSNPARLNADMLYATSAVAVDASSGRVLFSKEPDRKIYPASTTKVMTALLALENLDMDQEVTVTKSCMVGESSIYLEDGEILTVRELLYGLLLKSGNDAAVALAQAVSGTAADFAVLMNERAAELGCVNTHFNNPHGLPDKDHYTTAGDYYKIVLEASKHPEFMEIIGTRSYTIHAKKPDGTTRDYSFKNTNKMLPGSGEKFEYEYMLGGKTGYTDAAQSAFVGISQKGDMRVITVVFGSTTEGKWIDTQHLADYAFAAYSPLPLSEIYTSSPLSVQVNEAADPNDAQLSLELSDPDGKAASILCTESEANEIRSNFSQYIQTQYPDGGVTAPVQQGSVVGQMVFQYGEMEPVSFDLTASRTVAAAIPSTEPSATPASSSTSSSGVTVVTHDVSTGGWSPLYLLVIIPVVLFFILVIWLIVEIRRAHRIKLERERARRTEEVRRRRAQREYGHLQSNPLPRSQRPAGREEPYTSHPRTNYDQPTGRPRPRTAPNNPSNNRRERY